MRARARDDTVGAIVLGGAVVGLALVGSIALWAGTMEVSSAAIAPGVVVAEGNRKAVQHPDGGPVRTVLVTEGERVSEGQALIELDISEVAAEHRVLTSRKHQLEVRRARLLAEFAGGEPAFPDSVLAVANDDPEIRAYIDQEKALFEARRLSFQGSVALYRQQIEGSTEQISGLNGRLDATERQLDSVTEEHAAIAPLVEKGTIARNQQLALERTAASLEAELEVVQNAIAAEKSRIGSAELEIEQLTKARHQELTEQLTETEAELSTVRPRVASVSDRLTRGVITSPDDGYVHELTVFSRGASLLPGQVALQIVPVNEPLVLSVEISPGDIDRVKPGQGATVHLLAYQQRSQSIINGSLVKVSADRVEEPRTNRAYYAGIITVDPGDLARADAVLVPGMPVQALINTGSRTIAAYFLDPILQISDFALREG